MQVYAKTLIPGPHPVPALMATTDDADVLLPQLTARGCAPFGDPLPWSAAGEVVVGADRLQLVIDNQALLDDLVEQTGADSRTQLITAALRYHLG